MRIKKSLKNVIVTIHLQIISILISFFTRQYFVVNLGTSYLGLNGLFENVLSMLSLAELGFSTAIMFFLFKPIADNDHTQIKILLRYFKKIYNTIGSIIFITGIFIIPVLQFFTKSEIKYTEVVIYYIVYLAATSVTYFFSYKKTLLIAYQDKYISSIITYTVFILLNISQVLILHITDNYLLFLIAKLFFNIIEGIVVNLVTNIKYPFIKEKIKENITKVQKAEIIKNVKALSIHKFGGVVIEGTDNMIIANFVGLAEVGLYSNYNLLISAVNLIVGQIFTGIIASIGNLSITDDKKRFLEVYNIGLYINALIFITSTIVFWFIMSDFIIIWVGAEYLLGNDIIAIMLGVFLINGMRWITKTYSETMGLYWYDRYKPVFESIINLTVSLILARTMGIAGVLTGTLVSLLLTSFWVEPYVLYKYGFGIRLREYFRKLGFYFTIGFFSFIMIFIVNSIFYIELTLLALIVKGVLYSIIVVGIFVLGTLKTAELKGIKKIIFGLILCNERSSRIGRNIG